MTKTEIEKININDIKPAPYNPRVMIKKEMEKLKKGLKTHGLIDPIIIDLKDDNTVIGGHQRLEALKELYPDKTLNLIRLGNIGWVFNETKLDVKDKNDQKAKNLSLNKITGDWDYKILDEILLELGEAHYDIELTGFDEIDIVESSLTKELEEWENIPSELPDDSEFTNHPKEEKPDEYIICPNCKTKIKR